MELIVIFLIFLLLGFFYVSQKNYKVRNTEDKKEEIIQKYEKELQSILKKYEDDKTIQLEKKKVFLQNCNSELSRNIFFTHDESLRVIERLLKI